MYLMFEGTFVIGEYPMMGIEWLVEQIGDLLRNNMAEGPFKDLLIDGIIGGVGAVIVFLPNILILYFCISLMEDSGYMARAAFIMDKIMHKWIARKIIHSFDYGIWMQCTCYYSFPYY